MENQHQLHRGKRPASKTIYSISTLYLPAKLPTHAENCRPIRSNQSSSNWLVIVMPSHNYLLCTVPCYPYLLLLVNTIVFIINCFPGHYYCLCGPDTCNKCVSLSMVLQFKVLTTCTALKQQLAVDRHFATQDSEDTAMRIINVNCLVLWLSTG